MGPGLWIARLVGGIGPGRFDILSLWRLAKEGFDGLLAPALRLAEVRHVLGEAIAGRHAVSPALHRAIVSPP